MKNTKKKIGTALITSLPILVFLACGTAAETIELADLQQDNTATDIMLADDVQETAAGNRTESQEPKFLYVHICGEVVSPGVYRVAEGSRIYDVLLLAGGFSEQAAEEAVNLAEFVEDGEQIIIPSEEKLQEERTELQRQRAEMVNINTATAAELCALPGIGESRAEDIVAYRAEHGGFSSTEEIMQVSGIKEGLYKKIQGKIYIE